MALIRCPECGKEVSDQAEVCMSCGYPIQKWLAKQKAAEKAENPSGSYRPESGTEGSIPDNAQPFAEASEKSFTRRNRILGIIAILLVAGVGIFFAVRALIQPDYYQEGLKVTKMMGQLLQSETYANLYSADESVIAAGKKMAAYGYDSPVAVYSLHIKDPEKYISSAIPEERKSNWNNLSSTLKKQLQDYYGIGSFITYLANQSGIGITDITCMSIFQPILDTNITSDGKTAYLYVYNQGAPVVVSFGDHRATGTLFLGNHSLYSLSSVREIFEPYGFEVTQVKP